ncbi:helix-turn-helix domain-containing protein [Streptomyces griseoruber]|uniref:helix-turn-helix domain-containing protein n=1 Tax=Streptomyces griseoruber TaxID=1943 RepID=UPI001F0B31A7|nr:helix-turn-helix transcriptional regulator [Streptomyces griseoruber]
MTLDFRKGRTLALRTRISERQRRLGAELRRIREAHKITTNEAAAVAGLRAPFLSNIEGGRTAIATERLRRLCEHYGNISNPYVEALVAMSESSGKGWWSGYQGRVTQYALNLAELEAGSTTIHSYHPLLVPGLLQTEDYIRALFDDEQPRHATTEDAVTFRLERQRILTGESAPTVHVVIHEAALRMHYGGPKVMHGQLMHLIELARLPNVTIRIFPFRARTYSGVSAPFLYLAPPVEELATVVLDHPAQQIYRDSPEHLSQYRALFERLKGSALPPITPSTAAEAQTVPGSLMLIQHLLYDL